jgi:uncharacterized hydrophobic protein (TIGR00271 family)
MEPGGCKRWQSRQVDESQKLQRRAAERLGPIESTIAIMHGVAEAGMVHPRLVVPGDEAPRVLEVLERSPAVVNLVRLPGCSIKPRGDLVLCDVAREEVSVVVDQLRRLGLERAGSISIDSVDSTISTEASRAVLAATGSPADAVIWEEVEARTSESAELSFSFLAFMVLATLIAAVGILTDSQILIIGAMVVGPEFGPLAGLCVALVQGRVELARRSATALALGFPLAIAVTLLVVLLLRAAGPAPDAIAAQGRPATFFIAHPNTFSILVALLAGVAGLLSLTTAKSGALLGVLISVTTIPAAANVGVAAAYANWSELRGALAQLALNLACIVIAGVATLTVQRLGFIRRLRRAAT